MARTMPRLRLLCCRLATTEVGEYEGGMYDRHLCEGECGGCFTAHLCDVVALLRGWRAKEATATTQTSRRGYEARLADEIEALPLDGAAEVLAWLGDLIEQLLGEAECILRAQPGGRRTQTSLAAPALLSVILRRDRERLAG